jgi:uncharacterized membrane protein
VLNGETSQVYSPETGVKTSESFELLLPKLRFGLYNALPDGFGPANGETETQSVIAAWKSADGSRVRIRAKGNFSLDARGLLIVVLALAAATLLLAGLLAWQGFWPVFAIAVLQVVLVSWLLIRTWENTWAVETIEIGPEHIRIVSQRYRARHEVELQTAWAVVETLQPHVVWYDPSIRLRSGNRSVELGRFLTADEKRQLAEQLERAINRYSALYPGRNV